MVIYDLKTMQACDIKEKTVVALGTFDGCHLGHASVLRDAFYKAKEIGAKSVAYTFDDNGKNTEHILTLEERIKAISRFGIDYIAVEQLDNVRNLSGETFVNDILMGKLRAVCATCGFNYRFGKNAAWDAQDLTRIFEKSLGSVRVSQKIVSGGHTVSSTRIRELIKNGEVEELLDLMGPYTVYAPVKKGKGLGKEMGICTINQEIPDGKVVPRCGVYITECELGEDVYPSVTNIGYRPTTDGENSYLNVETHIMNYAGTLYGSYVRVRFYKYIREEKRFNSLAELISQIESDKRQVKSYFGY